MAERPPRYAPVRKRDTRTAKQQSRYVFPSGAQKDFSEFAIKLE